MLAYSMFSSFTVLALRGEGSLEGQSSHSLFPLPDFSSLRTFSPRRCRRGAPAPQLFPWPCSGQSSAPRFSPTRPLRSPCVASFYGSSPNLQSFQHSNLSTFLLSIPFRITSFADLCHVTRIESHSYKKRGRGTPYQSPTQALPIFSTPSKHAARRDARNSIPVMRLLQVLWTPGGWGTPAPIAVLHLRSDSSTFNCKLSTIDCLLLPCPPHQGAIHA
jgi:hypothetical protein